MVEYVDEEEQEDEMGMCVDAVLDVTKMIGSFLLYAEEGGQFQQNLAVTDLEE